MTWSLHYDTARRLYVASCVVDGLRLVVEAHSRAVLEERVAAVRGRVVRVP